MDKMVKATLVGVGVLSLNAVSAAESDAITLGGLGFTGPAVLQDTEVFVNGRLRAEYGEVGASDDGSVISLRNRFGFKTGTVSGFSVLAEGEHTWILNNSGDYSPFPGGAKSVIADPDNFDLNRLQLSYKQDGLNVIVGRQNVNHADQRFIGAVAWRQNDQTFDAATINYTAIEDLSLSYTYANQVNRIFGNNAPAVGLERWHGDVHLLRADYSGTALGTVSGFAYLMDFSNAAAFSNNTFGLEVKGQTDIASLSDVNYLFTAALQQDAGANADYEEYYFRADLSKKGEKFKGGVGLEWTTGNGANEFIFPLGTNHKFNGFADAFLLGNKGNGLRDVYAWVGTKCPCGVSHKLAVHQFSSDQGDNNLGYEIDYVAKKKLTDNTSVLFKFAHLEGRGAQVDVQRASLQLDYKF